MSGETSAPTSERSALRVALGPGIVRSCPITPAVPHSDSSTAAKRVWRIFPAARRLQPLFVQVERRFVVLDENAGASPLAEQLRRGVDLLG